MMYNMSMFAFIIVFGIVVVGCLIEAVVEFVKGDDYKAFRDVLIALMVVIGYFVLYALIKGV